MARKPRARQKGVLVGVRLQDDGMAIVDGWRAQCGEPKPSRPAAMRQLMAMGWALNQMRRVTHDIDAEMDIEEERVDRLLKRYDLVK